MNTWQEEYSGVGCKVLCGNLNVVGEGVAWESWTWSTVIGYYKVWHKVSSVTRTAITSSAFIVAFGNKLR